MSASSSFISILNDDVLSYIFFLNTHMPEIESGCLNIEGENISALDTARHTSQVCHSWRQLMLQSPSIWANIIDLDCLTEASEAWFEEVVGRTGEADLSIYGAVEESYRMRTLFTLLLDENWHRVCRLDVVISGDDLEDDPFQWDLFLTRPASRLKKFVVDGDIPDDQVEGSGWDDLELFDGSAPLLCRFHCPLFHFDHRALWVPQLLSLTIAPLRSIIDTLNVIAHAPHLESLVIESEENDELSDAKHWTQNIILPNLRRLQISSQMKASLVYLSRITPRPDCALILTIEDLTDTDTIQYQHLSKIILPYVGYYFGYHFPTYLNIRISNFGVEITSSTSNKAVYFGHPMFSIYIQFAHRPIDPVVIDTLLSTFASATFKTVFDFNFHLSNSKWYHSMPDCIQMFQSLTAVRRITMTPWAFHKLLNHRNSTALFPNVTEVAIQNHTWNQHTYLDSRLYSFLTRRKRAGSPVRILDLTGYLPIHHRDKWAFGSLQSFEGLKVIYERHGKRVEYLCGLDGASGVAKRIK